MVMTDVQARAYIQGEEPFDEYAWNKERAERLCKAVESAMVGIEAKNIQNLILTAKHYIRDDSPYMQCNPNAKAKIKALIHQMESMASDNMALLK